MSGFLKCFELNFEVNMTFYKTPYSDNYKFKILKCIWSPNEKRWCKRFSKKYYPCYNNEDYLNMINNFILSCCNEDVRIEYVEGLEELEESVFKNRCLIAD